VLTARRAGIEYTDQLGGRAPGEVLAALATLTDALLSSLVPDGQADALLRSIGLAALTADS
jgi:hypothetical protein